MLPHFDALVRVVNALESLRAQAPSEAWGDALDAICLRLDEVIDALVEESGVCPPRTPDSI
jgi:hypothetical protein